MRVTGILGFALAICLTDVSARGDIANGQPGFWPRSQQTTAGTFTVYQPQADSWDGFTLDFHAVASFQPIDTKRAPIYGVIHLTAATLSDKADQLVYLNNVTVSAADFPAEPTGNADYKAWFQWLAPKGQKTIPLAQLEADLAVAGVEKKARTAPVDNTPPQIVFSNSAAVLIYVDGDPVWRAVPKTSLQRIINTRALTLRVGDGGAVYVHLLNGWITAPTFAGPWTIAESAPKGATGVAKELGKAGTVDLMEGTADPDTQEKPSLQSGLPAVVVAFKPTEVITFQGAADWTNIQGTNLIYVQNTSGNVFRDLANNALYVLISGRWFTASSMAGPWAFVAPDQLPPDFAQIPDNSPKENVKASIPGTRQAQEAMIAASVPQTALVYPSKVSFKPNIAGVPVLGAIAGTSLYYVINSPDPIIQVSPTLWYAVQSGVWFVASSVQGPWVVATTVPAVLYTIPPSSPVYYVTYVQVYSVTPTYVVMGYTPGYMGAVITPSGVVVYGTGYVYNPYIGATVWYGPPVTYGYGAAVVYTPWTGWTVGYGFGMPVGVGVCWGPAPYWGPYYATYHGAYYGSAYGYHGGAAAWGPGGWAATTGNQYSHYGSTSVESRSSSGYNAYTGNAWHSSSAHSYNSTTGTMAAGQHGSVTNAYTGKSASASHGTVSTPGGGTNSYSTAHASGSDNYYGSKDGNVYKYNSQTGQTQQYNKNSGGWSNSSSNYASQSHNYSQSGSQRSSSAQSWGGGGGGEDHGGGGGGGGWDSHGGGGGWGGGGGGGGGGWGGRGGGGGGRR
jgi:hypothetical protein